MSIKDKLRVEIEPERISLQPNRGLTSSLIWFAITIIITAVIWTIFHKQLGEGGELLCIGIIIYLSIHGLIDYIFKLNVQYEFDRYANAVYRKNPLFGKKQLMQLDEVVIFTNADTGDWYYAMGIKKKQFLKNYKISPRFGEGKVSKKLAFDYEDEVLVFIEELIAKLPPRIR
ncbi:hypothetical protein LZQ00_02475 [Sphingobacterium sp. SRCM116780]|uniref:hypothetical protein n=1 Tax=Sphingobacterium sp. SRCM116780 TaxID=2907623 RepID=UPI001F3A41B7|nr:hypothetical protein [Sphingobacterium sp. SRCM116780]UIR56690.1 hypothetical protein LZQ00_02475 [Sphingobacterium sp. SRCM116780]